MASDVKVADPNRRAKIFLVGGLAVAASMFGYKTFIQDSGSGSSGAPSAAVGATSPAATTSGGAVVVTEKFDQPLSGRNPFLPG